MELKLGNLNPRHQVDLNHQSLSLQSNVLTDCATHAADKILLIVKTKNGIVNKK